MSVKTKINGALNGKLVRASSLMVFAGIVSGILGYLYQIVIARMLSPSDYGLFSAIMAVYIIAVSPMATLTMLVSRKVAGYDAQAQSSILSGFYYLIHAKSIKLALMAVVVFLLFGQYAMVYLKTDNLLHIVILGLLVVITVPTGIIMGFIQGLHMFRELATAQFYVAVSKIIFSIFFIWLGFGVSGSVMGVLLSLVVIAYWLHSKLTLSLFTSTQHMSAVSYLTYRESVPVFIANIAFTAMAYMDIVFVNYYFSPEEAGHYAVASILGKAIMYLPAGISQAMYPMVVTSHSRLESDISLLKHALLMVFALSLSGGLFYYFLSEPLILALFGADYSQSEEILKYYGLAILPLTMIMVAENYLIAKSQVLFAYLFGIALPFQLLAVYYYHESMMSIVAIMGLTGAVVSLVGFFMLWLHYRKGKL